MAENVMSSDHKDNKNYRDVYDHIDWVDYKKEETNSNKDKEEE